MSNLYLDKLLIKRALTDADRLTYTPDEGELVYCVETNIMYIGDGITVGGLFVNYQPAPIVPVTSVNSKTGDVVINKSDVGLGNVDNTSDMNKPISTLVQSALNNKADDNALADVAKSGDYDDLSNKPSIPAAQVNSDWNSSSGLSQILNKPTLGSAASQNVVTTITGTSDYNIPSEKAVSEFTGQYVDSWFSGAGSKSVPVDADAVLIADSADSGARKKTSFSQLKAWLSGLFLPLTGGTVTGQVKLHGDGTNAPLVINDPNDATQITGPTLYSGGEKISDAIGNVGIAYIQDLYKTYIVRLQAGGIQLYGQGATRSIDLFNINLRLNPDWGVGKFPIGVTSPIADSLTPYGLIEVERLRTYQFSGTVTATDIFRQVDARSATYGDIIIRTVSSTGGMLSEQHATTGDLRIKGHISPLRATVAELALIVPANDGATAFATDGKDANGNAGTPVYYADGKWRTYFDSNEVTS